MRRYFFDFSALAKRYHRETGTEKVALLFDEPGREIRISRLSFVEVQSVFAMKVRAGFIRLAEAGQQRARLVVDVAAGQIEVYAVTPQHFSAAERLIGKHSFTTRLRTLDALQLAVALDLAVREGLLVLNPETV